MSVQQNLTAVAGNDLLWHVAVTLNGERLDLTAYTPAAILKPTATSPDSAGTTFAIGTGLAWTYEQSGRFDWAVPHADTVPAGQMWYRIDVDNGAAILTAVYGTLTLIAA